MHTRYQCPLSLCTGYDVTFPTWVMTYLFWLSPQCDGSSILEIDGKLKTVLSSIVFLCIKVNYSSKSVVLRAFIMEFLFGKKKTPEEMLKQNQRALNRAMRFVSFSWDVQIILGFELNNIGFLCSLCWGLYHNFTLDTLANEMG